MDMSHIQKDQKNKEYLEKIIEFQTALNSADFNLPGFMNMVVERVQALTFATGAVIELKEEDEMIYKAVSGSVANYLNLRLKIKNSFSGLCILSSQILYSENTATDPRVKNKDLCKKMDLASMLLAPLSRKNEIVGVLKIVSNIPYAFNDSDIQILKHISGFLGGALGQQLEIEKRRKIEDQFRYLAHNDFLTGLPNRLLFKDRLLQAIKRNRRNKNFLVLMYMDIDHFKSINDTFGHRIGDALLKAFSDRVREVTREVDTLARMSGDEFTLIAENILDKEEVALMAMKIIEAMKYEFMLENHTFKVGVSIGIAMTSNPLIKEEVFIQQADYALYQAKKAGRNNFQFASEIT